MKVQPQTQSPPSAPQSGPPQGGPPGQEQSAGAQAVKMIQDGFSMLGKLIQSAQGSLPPEDIKLFQQASQSTEMLIESLTGSSQGQGGPAPAKPSPGGPMPANAAQDSKAAGY